MQSSAFPIIKISSFVSATLLFVSTGLFNEFIVESGVSIGFFLLIRSLVLLSLSSSTARLRGLSIGHRLNSKLWLWLLFSGLGTYAILSGYSYVSATLVSTLQRTDILVIFLIGLLSVNKLTMLKGALLLAAAFGMCLMVLLSSDSDESLMGYGLVFFGVLMLSISAHLTKQLAMRTNAYVLINISAYSGLLIGVVMFFAEGINVPHHATAYLLILMGSLSTYFFFKTLADLYATHTAEVVQFPALVGALLIVIPEMVFEQKVFYWPFIIMNILYLVIIALFLFQEKIQRKLSKSTRASEMPVDLEL